MTFFKVCNFCSLFWGHYHWFGDGILRLLQKCLYVVGVMVQLKLMRFYSLSSSDGNSTYGLALSQHFVKVHCEDFESMKLRYQGGKNSRQCLVWRCYVTWLCDKVLVVGFFWIAIFVVFRIELSSNWSCMVEGVWFIQNGSYTIIWSLSPQKVLMHNCHPYLIHVLKSLFCNILVGNQKFKLTKT